jgi:hypothetical protein
LSRKEAEGGCPEEEAGRGKGDPKGEKAEKERGDQKRKTGRKEKRSKRPKEESGRRRPERRLRPVPRGGMHYFAQEFGNSRRSAYL